MGNKRKYYKNNSESAKAKKSKLMFGDTVKLGPNMKGFLITYNCKFTFVINEAKKLLQQFSLPAESLEQSAKPSSNDLEKQLQEELDSLKSQDKEFQILDTGAKYTIFVNVKHIEPNQVVGSIFEHIEKTQRPLGRYVQRLLPVLSTCKSYLEDLEKCLTSTLDELDEIKSSENTAFKYCCVFKTSNNGNLARDDVFKSVGTYMQSKNKLNKVDYENPDYVLLINVICNLCFISFVKNFFQFRKYNLIEMGAKYSAISNKQTNEAKTDLDNDNNNKKLQETQEQEANLS